MVNCKLIFVSSNKSFEKYLDTLCTNIDNSDSKFKVEVINQKKITWEEFCKRVSGSFIVWADGLKAGIEISDKIPKKFRFLLLRLFPKDLKKQNCLQKINWSNVDVVVIYESLLKSMIFMKEISLVKDTKIFVLPDEYYEVFKSSNFKIIDSKFPEPSFVDIALGKIFLYLLHLKNKFKGKKSKTWKIRTNRTTREEIQNINTTIFKKFKSLEEFFSEVLHMIEEDKNAQLRVTQDRKQKITEIVSSEKLFVEDHEFTVGKTKRIAQIIKFILLNNVQRGCLFDERSNQEFSEILSFINKLKNYETKVLQAPVNTANQPYMFSNTLRKLGIYSKMLDYYPGWMKYKNNWVLQSYLELTDFIERLIEEYDIFHFHFGESLRKNHSDLLRLSQKNKALIMHYWGSDVRRISLTKHLNPYSVEKVSEEKIIKNLDKISKFIKSCIVADRELYEYVKDFHQEVYILKQAIDLSEYKVNNYYEMSKNKKPLIVHAPTDFELKGTEYIIKAIENLKFKYDFEFMLVHGMSHEKAKKIYQSADLIIDQIRLGTYGLFSIESMAMGKPVVAWIADYYLEYYPKELPIIRANPDTIESVLEGLLKNRESLPEIGKKSREYVEKYHNIDEIKYELLAIYYLISKEAGLL